VNTNHIYGTRQNKNWIGLFSCSESNPPSSNGQRLLRIVQFKEYNLIFEQPNNSYIEHYNHIFPMRFFEMGTMKRYR